MKKLKIPAKFMWANLHLEPIITKTTTNRDGIHYPTPVGHFYLSDNSNFFFKWGPETCFSTSRKELYMDHQKKIVILLYQSIVMDMANEAKYTYSKRTKNLSSKSLRYW